MVEADGSCQFAVVVPQDDLRVLDKSDSFGWFRMDIDKRIFRQIFPLGMDLPIDVLLGMRCDEIKREFFGWQELREIIRQLAAVEFAIIGSKMLAFPGNRGRTDLDGALTELAPVFEADALADFFGKLPVEEFLIGQLVGKRAAARFEFVQAAGQHPCDFQVAFGFALRCNGPLVYAEPLLEVPGVDIEVFEFGSDRQYDIGHLGSLGQEFVCGNDKFEIGPKIVKFLQPHILRQEVAAGNPEQADWRILHGLQCRGELVDVDEAGIVSQLFDGEGQMEGCAAGKIDAAAGNPDIARQHSECINQTDGKTALQMALKAEACPNVHRVMLGNQIRQQVDILRGLVGGGKELGTVNPGKSCTEFFESSDFVRMGGQEIAVVESAEQEQGQGRIATGPQLEIVIGLAGCFGEDRVDHDNLGAAFLRGIERWHGMDGGPGWIDTPENDELGVDQSFDQ